MLDVIHHSINSTDVTAKFAHNSCFDGETALFIHLEYLDLLYNLEDVVSVPPDFFGTCFPVVIYFSDNVVCFHSRRDLLNQLPRFMDCFEPF